MSRHALIWWLDLDGVNVDAYSTPGTGSLPKNGVTSLLGQGRDLLIPSMLRKRASLKPGCVFLEIGC